MYVCHLLSLSPSFPFSCYLYPLKCHSFGKINYTSGKFPTLQLDHRMSTRETSEQRQMGADFCTSAYASSHPSKDVKERGRDGKKEKERMLNVTFL